MKDNTSGNQTSNVSLNEIIRQQTSRDVPFFELLPQEQKSVLTFIKKQQLGIKIIDKKWFNVLNKKFYSTEYKVSYASSSGVAVVRKSFNTFEQLYKYVGGDIYTNSCFYGYVFSKKEIKKHSIKVDLLNFDSLIDCDIADFSFEAIIERNRQKRLEKLQVLQPALNWATKIKSIPNLKTYKAKSRYFSSKLPWAESDAIFYSLMVRNGVSGMDQITLELASRDSNFGRLRFDDVLLNYGKKAATIWLENDIKSSFRGETREHKRIRAAICAFADGDYVLRRTFGFNPELQLYYAKDYYLSREYIPLKQTNYFASFNEFKLFVKDDLRGANLLDAPISDKDLSRCETDKTTLFPRPATYDTYSLLKFYADKSFHVVQRWFDCKGNEILSDRHRFELFFDFAHFLKGDLSGGDYLECSNLVSLAGVDKLNFAEAKITSSVAKKLGLSLPLIPTSELETKQFSLTLINEEETKSELALRRLDSEGYSRVVSYISDIHLLCRLDAYHCKTINDVSKTTRIIVDQLIESATWLNVIAGDTSSSFDYFKQFIMKLARANDRTFSEHHFFFALGNHELWGFPNESLEAIVEQYRSLINEKGDGRLHLIHNNLFYYDFEWHEISERELTELSPDELKRRTRGSSVTLFGGLGFAGMNDDFNANNGIYMTAVDRETERNESAKFLGLYRKVISALKGTNLIIVTHMPMRDWGGPDIHAEERVVYINGHNHRNFYFDDGKKRIFADNQVGYKGKLLSFKKLEMDFGYEWFVDYKDGIYSISRDDYLHFYRGINETVTFNRQFDKLFMLKRDGIYMFFMRTTKGSMLILNGGAIKKASNQSLEYYYERMTVYSQSVRAFLEGYNNYQKQISEFIKSIGGDGYIHGSIVDIDFYNHVYINPLDGTITPYYALSIVEKYVYQNLPSLLKKRCGVIYSKYNRLINDGEANMNLIPFDTNLKVFDDSIYEPSTEMYRVSRIIRGLQYTVNYNVVRIWNDALIKDVSIETGRRIVSDIVNLIPPGDTDKGVK